MSVRLNKAGSPHLRRGARAGLLQTKKHLESEDDWLSARPPTAEGRTLVGRGDGPAAVWAHGLRDGAQLAAGRLRG